MKPFTTHQGIAAPLLRINVDTDAIIPSREMKTVGKRGLADGLFAGWRYSSPQGREPNPDFVLNQPQYRGATILLSGANFGCGSSREHAVWALAEYGMRCVIAPSFGSIFFNNCVRNGLLPVVLDEGTVQTLAEQVQAAPAGAQLQIDLRAKTVTAPNGSQHAFDLQDLHRTMLLEGLDPIGLTLRESDGIQDFIAQDRSQRPWVYAAPDPEGRTA